MIGHIDEIAEERGGGNNTEIILNFGKIGVLERCFLGGIVVFGPLVGFMRAQMRKLVKKR